MGKADVLDAAGEIIGEAFRLLRGSWQVALLYLAASTVSGFIALQGVVNIVLGYVLVSSMLRTGGLAPAGLNGGVGSYVLVSLASGLAIMLGLLLFILPGIYLMVRWMPVQAYALVGHSGVNDSLRSAWDATGDRFWPTFVALAFLAVPMLLAIVIMALAPDEGVVIPFVWLLIGLLLSSLSAMSFTTVGVAVFSLANGSSGTIEEVFG